MCDLVSLISSSLLVSKSLCSPRKKKSCGNRLLLFLNTIDTILCLAAFLKILIRYELRSSDIYESDGKDPPRNTLYNVGTVTFIVTLVFERTAAELSGAATCILSIIRTIGVWKPFHRINQTAIVIVVIVYTISLVIRHAFSRSYNWDIYMFAAVNRRDVDPYLTFMNVEEFIRISSFILIVTTLFVSTTLTVIKLCESINAPKRKTSQLVEEEVVANKETSHTRAIKTSVILAVTSIIFNSYVIIITLIDVVGETPSYSWWSDIYKSAIFLAIPVNSAINPGIYFLRIRAIRRFWWNMICKRSSKSTYESEIRVLSNPLAISQTVVIASSHL